MNDSYQDSEEEADIDLREKASTGYNPKLPIRQLPEPNVKPVSLNYSTIQIGDDFNSMQRFDPRNQLPSLQQCQVSDD